MKIKSKSYSTFPLVNLYIYITNMEEQSRELLPPSFTLYPMTTQDLKTCYQSELCKVVCTLNGPYYDRKHTKLEPLFNAIVTNNNPDKQLTNDHLVRIAEKVKEVLQNLIVPGKYQRMIFDVSFEIIESNQNNPPSFLLSPILNLLSYTCALRCLETIASFSCTAVILRNEKVLWDFPEAVQEGGDRTLVLCTEGRDKRAALVEFVGEFSYVEYEKMVAVAEGTNQELLKFQNEKVNQVFEMFHG